MDRIIKIAGAWASRYFAENQCCDYTEHDQEKAIPILAAYIKSAIEEAILALSADRVATGVASEVERITLERLSESQATGDTGATLQSQGDTKRNAERWRYFANSAQTALMLGWNGNPDEQHDFVSICNELADAAMRRGK